MSNKTKTTFVTYLDFLPCMVNKVKLFVFYNFKNILFLNKRDFRLLLTNGFQSLETHDVCDFIISQKKKHTPRNHCNFLLLYLLPHLISININIILIFKVLLTAGCFREESLSDECTQQSQGILSSEYAELLLFSFSLTQDFNSRILCASFL